MAGNWSQMESTSEGEDGKNTFIPLYTVTPLTSFPPERSGKLNFTELDSCSPSPGPFDIESRKRASIFSSTLNNDLDTSVDNLDDYRLKKLKLEDSPRLSEFSITQTPQKFSLEALRKATPVKSCEKLGSSEKNQILYPTVPCTRSPGKSPVKYLYKKRFSPAKKRLFQTGRILEHKIERKVDFVSLFSKIHNLSSIIELIFSLLSTKDLVQISMVSKTWRSSLFHDFINYKRYLDFVFESHSSKENYNISEQVSVTFDPDSPPVSPSRREFYKITKLAQSLPPGQSLKRCDLCKQPSVIQENIGQCQNINCNYITCLLCGSFSITGPENFTDKCQRATLVIEKKTNRNTNITLDTSDISSILTLTTPESRSMFDSGYISSDTLNSSTPSVRRNLYQQGFTIKREDKNILKDSNLINETIDKRIRRTSSTIYPVSTNTTPVLDDPPSPQHIVTVPCSKQSKKNLKRLRL